MKADKRHFHERFLIKDQVIFFYKTNRVIRRKYFKVSPDTLLRLILTWKPVKES